MGKHCELVYSGTRSIVAVVQMRADGGLDLVVAEERDRHGQRRDCIGGKGERNC